MSFQRLLRAGTPAEVSVLSVMALILGAGCLASAAFPMVQATPRELLVGLGLVGVAAAAALLGRGPDVSPVHLHFSVVLLTTLHGVMVAAAATERGLMMSALGYTWTAVYVAYFFRPRAARVYAALMITALGLGLLVARAPTDLSVWVTISTMVWVAVAVLTRLNARLRADAHTDGLTGLLNRTGFAVAAARQRAMARRRGEPLALAVIDLDDFKRVNDRDGHAAGDRLLVELAAAWTASLRPGDLLARFGGDEFVLLRRGGDRGQVDNVLARLARVASRAMDFGRRALLRRGVARRGHRARRRAALSRQAGLGAAPDDRGRDRLVRPERAGPDRAQRRVARAEDGGEPAQSRPSARARRRAGRGVIGRAPPGRRARARGRAAARTRRRRPGRRGRPTSRAASAPARRPRPG